VVCFGLALPRQRQEEMLERTALPSLLLPHTVDNREIERRNKPMSCPMLARCGNYGMRCEGRNFGECDFYKRLVKEPRKWRVGRK